MLLSMDAVVDITPGQRVFWDNYTLEVAREPDFSRC